MSKELRKFWFDGRCSADFGIMATGLQTYNAPERNVQMIQIPGRNGSLTMDDGTYKNIVVPYHISICRDFPDQAQKIRSWLMSGHGYKRLEDGYNPNHFRMAQFLGPLEVDLQDIRLGAEATIEFECKPERYLESGESPRIYQGNSSYGVTLQNPTAFDAKPLIKAYGTGAGEIHVSGRTVIIKDPIDQHLIIDSELMEAYRQDGSGAPENKNGSVRIPEYPILLPGDNRISWTGGISKIEITPRWWEL